MIEASVAPGEVLVITDASGTTLQQVEPDVDLSTRITATIDAPGEVQAHVVPVEHARPARLGDVAPT